MLVLKNQSNATYMAQLQAQATGVAQYLPALTPAMGAASARSAPTPAAYQQAPINNAHEQVFFMTKPSKHAAAMPHAHWQGTLFARLLVSIANKT